MSTPEDQGNGRISVSREALRAELLQLELRLADRLSTKAENSAVSELAGRVGALERSVADVGSAAVRRDGPVALKMQETAEAIIAWNALNPVDRFKELGERMEKIEDQTLNPDSVAAMVGEALRQNQARGWTNRERMLQALVAISVLATFVITVALNWPG